MKHDFPRGICGSIAGRLVGRQASELLGPKPVRTNADPAASGAACGATRALWLEFAAAARPWPPIDQNAAQQAAACQPLARSGQRGSTRPLGRSWRRPSGQTAGRGSAQWLCDSYLEAAHVDAINSPLWLPAEPVRRKHWRRELADKHLNQFGRFYHALRAASPRSEAPLPAGHLTGNGGAFVALAAAVAA